MNDLTDKLQDIIMFMLTCVLLIVVLISLLLGFWGLSKLAGEQLKEVNCECIR